MYRAVTSSYQKCFVYKCLVAIAIKYHFLTYLIGLRLVHFKITVVTGASAGIGAAIVVDLANAGLNVIGLDRRPERLEELKSKISPKSNGSLAAHKCDVSKESKIKSTFDWIKKKFGGVDILVNNADIVRTTKLTDENNSELIQEVINTNVLGLVFCTREAFQSMKSRGVDGHVVLINSVLGHKVSRIPGVNLNIYPASKFAVTAVTETFRQEFQSENTKIQITSISPGAVRTEIASKELFDSLGEAILESEDISQAVLYALGTP